MNLVCLSEREAETFLPEGRLEEVLSLLQPARLVDPLSLPSEEAWLDLLAESNPTVMVAAWKTPRLPENIAEVAPALSYLCYLPGSVRHLVPRSVLQDGLLVTNWSSSVSRTISESALMMAMACMRRVRYWTEEMHFKGGWKNDLTETASLLGRRVGLHGLGLIAQKLVELLKPITPNISAYSPNVPDSIFEKLEVQRSSSLQELFSQNDVIVELAALTDKTRGMVTEDLLRMIPHNGAFVNVGRGAVVDEEGLARVAAERPDLQVALDVYKVEPLPLDSPFRGMKNVLLLPHLGGPTTDRRRDAGDHGLRNLRRYLRGEDVVDPLNLSMYDRAS